MQSLALTNEQQKELARERLGIKRADKIVTQERTKFIARASRASKKILDSQLIAANGSHVLVALEYDDEGKIRREIVRQESRIEKFLTNGVYGEDYIVIEGKPADWRAGDAVLNRAWGKPKETVEHSGDVSFTLRALNMGARDIPPAEVLRIDMPDEG